MTMPLNFGVLLLGYAQSVNPNLPKGANVTATNPPSYLSSFFGWLFTDVPITMGQQVVEIFWICLLLSAILGILGVIRFVVMARPLLVTLILRLSLLSFVVIGSYYLFNMGEWPTATTLALVWILLVSRWWGSFRPAAVSKAWQYHPPGFRWIDWARSWGIHPLRSRVRPTPPPRNGRHRELKLSQILSRIFSGRFWLRMLGQLLWLVGSLLTGLARAIEREQKAAAAKNTERNGVHQAKPAASTTARPAAKPAAKPAPPPKSSPPPPPPPRPPLPKGGMSEAEALKLLGLPAGASMEQIRIAHRRLMIRYHPDHGGDSLLAARVNQAKDVLLGR